jgi:hypothetical protein
MSVNSIQPLNKILGAALATLLFTANVCAQSLVVTLRADAPEEYSPFVINVAAAAPVCLSGNGPLFVDAQLDASTLRLVTTHVDSASCVQSRDYTIAGLPAGRFTIEVVATRTAANATNGVVSEIAAMGTASVAIAAVSQVNPVDIVTVESNLGFGFRNADTVVPSPPIVTTIARLEGAATVGSTLPTRAFKAWQKSAVFPTTLPKAAKQVFALTYPGVRSTFMTLNEAERDRLLALGFVLGGEGGFWALPAVNGGCAFGALPVFRLFSASALMHRYTPHLQLANALAANGYVMELVSFCVPA